MCMCGDLYCKSCGPAQGNSYCSVCGSWSMDGGCADPVKCSKAAEAAANEEEQWYKMTRDSLKNALQDNPE